MLISSSNIFFRLSPKFAAPLSHIVPGTAALPAHCAFYWTVIAATFFRISSSKLWTTQIQIYLPSQLTGEHSLSVQTFGDIACVCQCWSATNQIHIYIIYIIFILPQVQEQDIGPTIPWSQQFGPPARPVPFLFLEPCYVSSNACGQALWLCLFDKAMAFLEGKHTEMQFGTI